ncbi:MAG: NAD(P)/FAD-dependent oxidoreductase, partial [Actinomycetota bacterium]
MVVGPMVWGISPEFAGSGLGALTYALRHVGTVGRPVGGSGMVPRTILAAFLQAGGELRTDTKVSTITCEGPAVRGVSFTEGTEVRGRVVVSACNPHDTFLNWLKNPPPQASGMVERWRTIPHDDGYESKIDAVMTQVPHLRAAEEAGLDGDLAATYAIAPSIADMHRGYQMMAGGKVLDRPGLLANVPTVGDDTLAPAGIHVLSLEALYTPYGLSGGWRQSAEPARWLELFSGLAQPEFFDSIREWRAMTPDRYETDFHLPHGHATSFAGGPLAALRNANRELTRYETDVKGLYLTGAATFPGAGVWGASGRNAAITVLRSA